MCDQALRCLPSRGNDIDESNTVQTLKLFKIDVSVLIAVDVEPPGADCHAKIECFPVVRGVSCTKP